MEPSPIDAVSVDMPHLKDRLDELRRSLFVEQSRLRRRRDDIKRLSELEARLQGAGLSADDREAVDDACRRLRRAIDHSRVIDGGDDEIANRTAQMESTVAHLERQLREVREQEASANTANTADSDRERERVQRARRQKLVTTTSACARQLDTLEASTGVTAAAAAPVDEDDLSDDALRARLHVLLERGERVVQTTRDARYRTCIRVAALELELAHWGRLRSANKGIDVEALSRHLRGEFQRFIELLEAHLSARLDAVVQYLNESTISRFNQTDSEPEADLAFEQISFRSEDIQLLSNLTRYLVEPHLQAQSLLLPARSAIALMSFRGSDESSHAFDALLSRLAYQPHLQVPAIPAPLIERLVQNTTQLKDVAPLAPRVEAPPLRRLRRGDAFGAIGAVLTRTSRFLPKLLQPLAILGLLGYSVLKVVRTELSKMMGSTAALALAVLIMLTYRSWTKEARLSEVELLRKGKTMLRDRVAKQLDQLRQIWKRQLTEHCDHFIDQITADLKKSTTSTVGDDSCIQREYSRVESELSERTNDQRRLLDAHLQARRIANDNIRALSVAVQTELALSHGGESE